MLLREARHKVPHVIRYHLYKISIIEIHRDRKISGCHGWPLIAKGVFGGDEGVLKLDNGYGCATLII